MAEGSGAYEEHHFRRVISGDVEAVRKQLCDVLEQFNYVVLGETPIQARRSKTRNIWVSTILHCEGRLTIGLRSISPASTLATFDYSVSYLWARSDRCTLEREADAIITLATRQSSPSVCQACGIESSGSVRFCRSCGAALSGSQLPPEVEIMRLSAAASSSQQEISVGVCLLLAALAVGLPFVLISQQKAFLWLGCIVLAIGSTLALFFLTHGLRRLHGLFRAEAEVPLEPAEHRAEKAVLPSPPLSVTEGTTSLIDAAKPMPVMSHSTGDTDPMS